MSGKLNLIEKGLGKMFSFLLLLRALLISILISGMTGMPITLQGEKRGLISKRPSYRPTGAHLSPKSVLA